MVHTRARWPQDIPLAICMRSPRWLGSCCEIQLTPLLQEPNRATVGTLFPAHCGNAAMARVEAELLQIVGRQRPGESCAQFTCTVLQAPDCWRGQNEGDLFTIFDEARAVPSWSGIISVPVRAVPRIEDAITPVAGPEVDALMRVALKVSIWLRSVGSEEDAIISVDFDRNRYPLLESIAYGFTVEVRHHDSTMAKVNVPPLTLISSDENPGTRGGESTPTCANTMSWHPPALMAGAW